MIRLGIDARIVKDKPSGLVSYVKNLIGKLIQDNSFELFIFGQTKYQSVFAEFLTKKNVHFVPVYFDSHFLSLKNFLYEYLSLHTIIHSYALDLFHNPFGYGVPPFLNGKVILTVHDVIPLYSYDKLTFLQTAIYKKSLAISTRKASHIVSISQFTKKDLLKNYPALEGKPVSVIHNGFDNLTTHTDDNALFAKLKNTYSLPEKYIIYLGSGTDRKNLVRLTEGFIMWKKKYRESHKLVLISKFNRPETAVTLEKIHSLVAGEHLSNEIIHIQYVNNQEKAVLLSNADLFIYPSIYEGFGLPLLEAASCNVPICCSDMAVFHEVCGDGAIYFNPFDAHSISQAINSGITDTALRTRMIRRAQERIALFSWSKMTSEYITLYKKVTSGASA
jgi:glycosyltransferase involved in cell wall biosynthesis